MEPIRWTAAESQAMDRWLVEERGRTIPELMAVAGRRVAEVSRELIAARGLTRVVLLVGPGNNGGDARVAEELLRESVPTCLWCPLEDDELPDELAERELGQRDLVVDGLFGVGLLRPIEGAARAAVEGANASDATVLAIDVPSGMSSDDGTIVGVTEDDPDGGVAVRADRTVTFVGPKRGFFLQRGPDLTGDWTAVDIGFPVEQAEQWVRGRRAAAPS